MTISLIYLIFFFHLFLNDPQYNPEQARNPAPQTVSRFSHTATSERSILPHPEQHPAQTTSTVPQFLWDKDPDLDDALHNPDMPGRADRSFTIFSARGWMNAGALFLLVAGLLVLFAGYPIIQYYSHPPPKITGYNLGGINATGQIPNLPGLTTLIDPDTPTSAYKRTGWDGKTYDLVFSDEFNTDGRTFYPGDDPFWEAVDLQYWSVFLHDNDVNNA